MISMHMWQRVKTLRAKGMSIKKIAKTLKLSKNTVRKYLRSSEPPHFKARQYEKILGKHKEKVEEMIQKRYIGTRIYAELKKVGYEGSLSSVHRYIQEIKMLEEIDKKITTRFETPPGKQMQYDWKEWDLPVDGKVLRIYLHETVLSYSRKKYYTYSLGITTTDVIRAIEEAIHSFSGVPEELVIDNPKQMIIVHEKNDVIRYNDDFLKFCGLYGIEPSACQNYRPRTKGKAERPFYYLQEHLLRGLEVKHLSEFDRVLMEFNSEYNARPHSTLKEAPDERFLREKEYLRRIPMVDPAILYRKEFRQVSNDGYIPWNGKLYPVPMNLCLKKVMIDVILGKELNVYDLRGNLVARHEVRIFDNEIRPIHPEHEERNNTYMIKRKARISEITNRFVNLFKETGENYVKGLRTSVGANVYWHIKEIVDFSNIYGVNEVLLALNECIKMGAYHKNSVGRVLADKEVQKSSLAVYTGVKPLSVEIKRPLAEYRVEV